MPTRCEASGRAKDAWDSSAHSRTKSCRCRFANRKTRQTEPWTADEHMRPDTTAEGLAKLPPYFKKDGVVTAGNASGICDGGAAVIVAGEEFVRERKLKPIGRLVAWAVAGVEPKYMGIGPAPAARKALARAGLTLDQMDLVEVNEAFAAAVPRGREGAGPRPRAYQRGRRRHRDRPSARGERHPDHPAPAARPAAPRQAVRPGQRLHRRRPGGGGHRGSLSELETDGRSLHPRPRWPSPTVVASLRVLKQYERGVTFFLGAYTGDQGTGPDLRAARPGAHEAGLAPDRGARHPAAGRDHPGQRLGQGERGAVHEGQLCRERAIIEIENYLYATSQLAQTTLRSVLGETELDELLADREKINAILKKIIDERTDAWGIEVSAVEVKDVDLPTEMKRAMARQAEAERERRAKVIAAQGELQASQDPGRCGAHPLHRAGGAPAALPPDGHRDRGREQLDDTLPDPDRDVPAVPRRGDPGVKAPSRQRAPPLR